MDYGHDLTFGTFTTPQSRDPHVPVRLAQAAEEVGLDLVTFQDHPYQPAFLDTWTLLTWVASSTERVTVAANVHCLPLRPPAVLARAAASLDLLSGGRFALGLGAGAFWDAIVAMGGERLSPPDAVQGVAEAIAVVRGIWDTSTRERLVVDGRVHRLDGAKRGPAPAHDVPIWVGALGPRMLRLVGERADGWSVTLGRLDEGGLTRGNAIIDEAASGAGRSPSDVRRMVNLGGAFATEPGGFLHGPAEQWVRELSRLALEDGVGTFILASDDERDVRVFGQEVAPGVRETVAAARS
jgi:alkanesulfonate monooxygenase SsuD/methylene tetrahydromethanopterin reductase-like flavin-dependent oxidoreductase (luciferase family)